MFTRGSTLFLYWNVNTIYISVSGDDGLSDNNGSFTVEIEVCVDYPGVRIIFLFDNSCRVIYKGKRHPKDKSSYISMHKDSCQRRVVGYHTKLREKNRTTVGHYEGFFENKILTATISNTKLSDSDVEDLKNNTSLADHTHVSEIATMLSDGDGGVEQIYFRFS